MLHYLTGCLQTDALCGTFIIIGKLFLAFYILLTVLDFDF